MKTFPAFLTALLRPLLIACVLISCGSEKKEPATVQQEPASRPYEWVEENWQHPDCETGGQPCVTLTFKYPHFRGDDAISDSLRSWVEKQIYYPEPDAPPTDGQKLAHEWFDDYNYYASEIEGYEIAWNLERKIEVVHSTDNYISLHLYEYSFSGGAHSSEIDLFRSFAIPEGETIHLTDLTYDSFYLDRLKKLAEEQYRYTYELLEGNSLDETGSHFLDHTFQLPANFAFTEYGLLFYFNSWEVAPYATGPITIELSYEDLEPLLRSRWLPSSEKLTLR